MMPRREYSVSTDGVRSEQRPIHHFFPTLRDLHSSLHHRHAPGCCSWLSFPAPQTNFRQAASWESSVNSAHFRFQFLPYSATYPPPL
jgi:hypothetical protein